MISFKIGNENRPVIESRDFDNSIFSRQYRTALNIADNYFKTDPPEDVGYHDNDFSFQGIAFCGERGDGKTSAMLSVLNILHDAKNYVEDPRRESDGTRFIKSVVGEDSPLLKQNYSILRCIDPTRFVNYNILEVIITELYDNINRKKQQERDTGLGQYRYNDIYMLFEKVNRSIKLLSKPEEKLFDSLENLEDLSAVVMLQQNIRKLIKEYLQLNNSKRLIITIDDMDMKITGSFGLTERLRKYLAMPEVVVLMSVKTEQLLSSVEHALRKSLEYKNESFSNSEISHMSEKYITKLLPQGSRVNMSGTDRLFDRKFEILDQTGRRIYYNETLKDGLLELIFIKTRYLFYNSLGEISTLFPNNLRELFQLIGMMAEMRDIKRNGCAVHRANQQQFKNYFFRVWTECLNPADRETVLEWSTSTMDYTLNKDVVKYLHRKLSPYIDRTPTLYSKEDDDEELSTKKVMSGSRMIRNSILNPDNYTYNVSIGDVFFILAGIEREVLPDKDYKLIFFIRSLYSIKMYDKYDHMTHNHLIFPPGGNSGGIYRNDERFNHVNILQRLVGGSYFTFVPREFIAGGRLPLDRRVIKGADGLNKLINDIVTETDFDNPNYSQALKLAEFFVLTISHGITSKRKMAEENEAFPVKYMTDARKESDPIAFSRFSAQRGYYEFNLLAPFANLVNIRYAYYRFENGDKLFERALGNPRSLLCQMWCNAWLNRGHNENDWFQNYLKVMEQYRAADEDERIQIVDDALSELMSIAIIRNAEVLVALSDHFHRIREDISRKGVDMDLFESLNDKEREQYRILDRLRLFYSEVASSKSAMSTHRFRMESAEKGVRHRISFSFCHILSEFLKEIDHTVNDAYRGVDNSFNRFFKIFDWDNPDLIENTVEENEVETLGDLMKRYLESIFKVIGFVKNEKKSLDEIFYWLKFPNPEDSEQEACMKAMSAIRDCYNVYPFKEKVTPSGWVSRALRNPDLWFDFLGNPYFLSQQTSVFHDENLDTELWKVITG